MKKALLLTLSLGLLLMSLFHTAPFDMFSIINADSMFFHAMYNDLLVEGNCLWGWDLNTTFNLMPNAILYLASLIIVNHPLWAQVVHGLFQYALMIWAIWYLLLSLTPRLGRNPIAVAALLPAWFFLEAIYSSSFFFAGQFMHPYHMGAFIMCCFIMGLTIRQLREPHNRRMGIILLLLALSVFSNRIFIMMFVAPWLLTLLVMWLVNKQQKRNFLTSMAIVVAGSIAGLLLFVIVKNIKGLEFHPTHLFSWQNIWPSFKNLWKAYYDFIISSQVFGGLILFGLGMLAVQLRLVIMNIRSRLVSRKIKTYLPDEYLLFMTFSVLFAPLVFFAPVANGMFFDASDTRYNFMVIVWLMLGTAPLTQIYLNEKKGQPLVFFSLFAAMLLAMVMISRREHIYHGADILSRYYPSQARAVDHIAIDYDLKYGISRFWDAKPATAFSTQGVRVRQVYHDLKPYYLGGSRNWYYQYCPGMPQPVFNFIIHHESLDTHLIPEIFGNQVDTIPSMGYIIYKVPEFYYDRERNIHLR
jgi:hypothetical protein